MDIDCKIGRMDILMRLTSVTPSLDEKKRRKKRPKNEAQNDDDGVNPSLSFLITLKKHVRVYLFTLPSLCSH